MASDKYHTPRPPEEIAESLSLIRSLVALAEAQLEKSKVDLGLARAGLFELEAELNRGVQS